MTNEELANRIERDGIAPPPVDAPAAEEPVCEDCGVYFCECGELDHPL